MKKSKKGFTLIELLVVVLIIGILAAIAVPQYQKAVAKAELAQIISLAKIIKEAEEFYYLNKNTYGEIEDLDISTNPSDVQCKLISQSYFRCYNNNFSILYYLNNSNLPTLIECSVNSLDENSALLYACKDFLNNHSKNLGDVWIKTSCSMFKDSPNCLTLGGY